MQRGPPSGPLCQSGRQDLNLRPPGPQPGALPDCATPRDRLSLRRDDRAGDRTRTGTESLEGSCATVTPRPRGQDDRENWTIFEPDRRWSSWARGIHARRWARPFEVPLARGFGDFMGELPGVAGCHLATGGGCWLGFAGAVAPDGAAVLVAVDPP